MSDKSLKEISTNQIIRNPENPRMYINEEKLKVLQASIKEVGILVPLTLFYSEKDKKYMIIDGERRWRCAQNLKMKKVPAIVIPEPTPQENLLRMFSIHHSGEQWSLITTALKLEELMVMQNTTNEKELSSLTTMSRRKIITCKKILSYPRKYLDILFFSSRKGKLKPDFFVEFYPVRQLINSKFSDDFKLIYNEEKLLDTLIEKFINNNIKSARQFRKLEEILEKYDVEKQFFSFLKNKDMLLEDFIKIYDPSSYEYDILNNIMKSSNLIETINKNDIKNNAKAKELLHELIIKIEKILK